MTHFVLHARGATTDADIQRIAEVAGVTVLESEVGGALLVDTTKDVAIQLREEFPDWIIAEKIEYPPPDTKPYKIKREDQ